MEDAAGKTKQQQGMSLPALQLESELLRPRRTEQQRNRRVRAGRAAESPRHRAARLKKDRDRKKAARKAESPQHKAARLKKDRERREAAKKAAPLKDKERLRKDRERKPAKIASETPQEKEARCKKRREGEAAKRVARKRAGLVLNTKLDLKRDFKVPEKLLSFERRMRVRAEK